MKKLLGIVVLGLLFISIDLSNPTRVEAVTFKEFTEPLGKKSRKDMGFFERQLDKYDSYKQKKEDCADEASDANNSFSAKKVYNACMDD